MKKLNFLFFFGLMSVLSIYSCSKSDDMDLAVSQETDTPQFMDIDAEPAFPDLVITAITSDLPVSNGACGNNVADATCSNGQTGQVDFKMTIIIENTTNVDIPASDDFFVDWCLAGVNCISQFVDHPGIPGGTSIRVESTTFSLACPTGPPPYALVTRTFYAIADSQNDVREFSERNNFSDRYFVCDDE